MHMPGYQIGRKGDFRIAPRISGATDRCILFFQFPTSVGIRWLHRARGMYRTRPGSHQIHTLIELKFEIDWSHVTYAASC